MLPINVTTAIEMDENTKNGILNKLTEITGMTVVPDYTIDSKIKGGLKVQIDTWVYDASISNKLNALYTKLTTGN
jgi:F0F1-type ATP synthase delta subunit